MHRWKNCCPWTVTSVARKKQPLNEVAAAAFVITSEDIRRSGVTSLPEALRRAARYPGSTYQCQQVGHHQPRVNSQFANKLLVMIDGRTVYSPSFSGVTGTCKTPWLEDIDRIEVIRGPGASIWGANAVNGVINIITRSAGETQGGFVTAGGGTMSLT